MEIGHYGDRARFCVGLVLVLLGGIGSAHASEVVLSQDLDLKNGWNLFTLKVTPAESAEAFFAGWPLVKAGEYDADAAQSTEQFSTFSSTEGARAEAWRMYVPGNPDITTLTRLSANATYLVKLTNA